MAHGQDDRDFETVGVIWWQIESSFASQAIEALMTWGYQVGETVIVQIDDATEQIRAVIIASLAQSTESIICTEHLNYIDPLKQPQF